MLTRFDRFGAGTRQRAGPYFIRKVASIRREDPGSVQFHTGKQMGWLQDLRQ